MTTLPAAYTDIRGLAYRESDSKVYYWDESTESLMRYDTTAKKSEYVVGLILGTNGMIDEITFINGHLFVSLRYYDPLTTLWSMRLAELDLVTAAFTVTGPVITDCSAHSLLIQSIPEVISWKQISGPGVAAFTNPADPATTTTYSVPGQYVLELSATALNGTVISDTVTVDVL